MAKKDKKSKKESNEIDVTIEWDGNKNLMVCFLRQLLNSTQLYYNNEDKEQFKRFRNSAIQAFVAIKPENEIEAMLIAQMVTGYHASMKCFERASMSDQPPEFKDMYFKHAEKLSKIYIEQVTALNKMRGKGQQKVIVKHIHIHEGGKAIVGNVNSGGGSQKNKTENKPHAITHAPEQAMRSIDQKAEQVPVTSDEER